jgi:hypothetical protein
MKENYKLSLYITDTAHIETVLDKAGRDRIGFETAKKAFSVTSASLNPGNSINTGWIREEEIFLNSIFAILYRLKRSGYVRQRQRDMCL